MQYEFEWDPEKARRNWKKHGVSFEQASSVFRDPQMLTLFDIEHSEDEQRWITLGISLTGSLLVVHHTFQEIGEDQVRIRIFSSRSATRRELLHYSE